MNDATSATQSRRACAYADLWPNCYHCLKVLDTGVKDSRYPNSSKHKTLVEKTRCRGGKSSIGPRRAAEPRTGRRPGPKFLFFDAKVDSMDIGEDGGRMKKAGLLNPEDEAANRADIETVRYTSNAAAISGGRSASRCPGESLR